MTLQFYAEKELPYIHPTVQLGYWGIVVILQTLLILVTLFLEIVCLFIKLPEISFLIALMCYEFERDKVNSQIQSTFYALSDKHSSFLTQELKIQNILNSVILTVSFIYSAYLIGKFITYNL